MREKADRKLTENFIYHSLFQIVAILVPIIITPHLSRTIGADGIGDYSYTYTIGTYFAMFCLLSMNTYGNRECAFVRDDKNRLSRVFWEVYGVQIFTSVIAILAFVMYILLFANKCKDYLWIQTIYIVGCALDVTWLFYGLEKFKKIVFRNIVIKVLMMFSILTLVKTSNDTWIYVLIMASAILLSQLILWPFVIKEVDFVRPSWRSVRDRIWPVARISGPQLSYYIYMGINKLLLANMVSMSSVAFLSNSEGMSRLPAGVVTALTTVLLPRVSNLYAKGDIDRGKAFIQGSMRLTLFVAFPCAFGLSAIADKMVPWYYGDEFTVCGPMIQYMAFIVIIIAWAEVLQTQYLLPMKKDRVLLQSALLGIAVSIISNLILIPRFGAIGAGYAVMITEGSMALYKTVWSRKAMNLLKALIESLPFFICAVVMYFVVKYVGNELRTATAFTTIKQIAIGGLVYLAGCSSWMVIERYLKRGNKK